MSVKVNSIIAIVLVIIIALLLSKTTITINPFKITVERPLFGLGYLLLSGVTMLVLYHNYK